MKKVLLLLLSFGLILPACAAGDDKPIQVNELPATAQEFISTHFAGTQVMLATVDKEIFDTSYKVVFENSAQVEFDKDGEWKEIEFRNGSIPASIVPEEIRTYLHTHFPNTEVKGIDRDKHDYEVKLSSGMELKFDRNFNLIDMDN